ncbi:hypothetical protein QUA70_12335 [Microcoleus sp. LAD1_D5]|uniref:hypothetical protein n=1 Tax=unclassified Microcoleus TaxID=2642155 RepID=UPI002FD41FE1
MSADERIKTLRTVRGKDLKIRYTQDNLVDALINQRQFYDQNGQILAPTTPKLLERQIMGNNSPIIARIGGIEPRFVAACFGSAVNVSGESNFTVLIPYAPGNTAHNEHIREILTFVSPSSNLSPPFPLSVNYHGENRV